MLSYEKADWKSIVVYANELGMETDILAQIYFDCVEMVNEIWENFANSDLQTRMEEEVPHHKNSHIQ